jgi:hypothetical protein
MAMNTRNILTLTLSALALASAGDQALAQSCAYPQPIDIVGSGDIHYDQFVTNDHIARYWRDFALDREDWDENWGYDDPGNLNLPFARAMTGFWALENSAPWGAGSDNFLTWGYRFSVDNIDEIRTECTLDFIGRTRDFFLDSWTKLGIPWFYHSTVPERAGTVVHEARHANGVGHSSCGCPRGKSCDKDWNYFGANTYQVIWLEWFASTAANTTPAMQQRARDRANEILSSGFCTDPGFRI